MIIFQIQGGLGNQLFQIFSGLNYQLIHNQEIFFSKNNRNKDRGIYWDNLFYELKNKLKNEKLEVYKEPYYHYCKIPNLNNKLIIGFFKVKNIFMKILIKFIIS